MINKVLLVGKLPDEPKYGETQNGVKYCNFSVMTLSRYKDQEKTEYTRVSTFGDNAEYASKNLKKDCFVVIEGKLETRKYTDKNGHERTMTGVGASQVHALSLDANLGQKQANQAPSQQRPQQPPQQRPALEDNSAWGGQKLAAQASQYADADLPF